MKLFWRSFVGSENMPQNNFSNTKFEMFSIILHEHKAQADGENIDIIIFTKIYYIGETHLCNSNHPVLLANT
jgi:hypothetical protein